jgi:hypothetical protein
LRIGTAPGQLSWRHFLMAAGAAGRTVSLRKRWCKRHSPPEQCWISSIWVDRVGSIISRRLPVYPNQRTSRDRPDCIGGFRLDFDSGAAGADATDERSPGFLACRKTAKADPRSLKEKNPLLIASGRVRLGAAKKEWAGDGGYFQFSGILCPSLPREPSMQEQMFRSDVLAKSRNTKEGLEGKD